jgi:hypothetical protein
MACRFAVLAIVCLLAAWPVRAQVPGTEAGRYTPPPGGAQSISGAPNASPAQPNATKQSPANLPTPPGDASGDSWLGLPRDIVAKANEWKGGERTDPRYAPSLYRRNSPSLTPPAMMGGPSVRAPETRTRRTWRDGLSRLLQLFD